MPQVYFYPLIGPTPSLSEDKTRLSPGHLVDSMAKIPAASVEMEGWIKMMRPKKAS